MRFAALLVALALPVAAHAAAAPAARKSTSPASDALAKQLADAANVAQEDVVLVRTGPDTLPLAELLVAEAAKRGAAASIDYLSPAAVHAQWTEMPEGLLERPSAIELNALQTANVIIDLDGRDDPGLQAGVDPVRLAHVRRAWQSYNDALYRTEIRHLRVGGAAYPTEESAKLFKADPAAFARTFWDAVGVKTALLDDRTGRVQKVLAGLKEIKITTPNGTNLTLRLAGTPLYVDNGRIDETVMARPGPKEAALPAGVVAAAPHDLFGSGTLVVDAFPSNGVIVKDLHLKFDEGKAEAESGGENFEAFKKAFALASGAKAVVGIFAIGVNESSKPPAGSTYRSPEMSGAVTVGIGWNKDVGGLNEDTAFAARFTLLNATVKVNDQVVVENGQLKVR